MAGDIPRTQRLSLMSHLLSVSNYFLLDAITRVSIIINRVSHPLLFVLSAIPTTTASAPRNASASNPTDPDTVADAHYRIDLFSWREWSATAASIRTGTNRLTCNQNLSAALSATGSLAGATYNAASGALTLLPTAGALIGSPTKELWVVYKLMPVAGILSMLLSLGGNIVPSNARDYELNPATFSYGGMIATQHDEHEAEELEVRSAGLQGAQAFAARVKARSQDYRGGTKYIRVWYGVILQCALIGILLGACWFTQSGSVLVWWCKVRRPTLVTYLIILRHDSRRGAGCTSGT